MLSKTTLPNRIPGPHLALNHWVGPGWRMLWGHLSSLQPSPGLHKRDCLSAHASWTLGKWLKGHPCYSVILQGFGHPSKTWAGNMTQQFWTLTWYLTILCDSSSKRVKHLLWASSKTRHAHMCCTNRHTFTHNSYTYKIISFKVFYKNRSIIVHAFISSTWEAEVRESPSSRPAWSIGWVQDSQGYTKKPCLKKKNVNHFLILK